MTERGTVTGARLTSLNATLVATARFAVAR